MNSIKIQAGIVFAVLCFCGSVFAEEPVYSTPQGGRFSISAFVTCEGTYYCRWKEAARECGRIGAELPTYREIEAVFFKTRDGEPLDPDATYWSSSVWNSKEATVMSFFNGELVINGENQNGVSTFCVKHL